jgi:methionyl-tRNA formyltransferase
MGVAALIEAADLVVNGRAQAIAQDESCASYEGWCREPEARINWHTHVDQVYNLIRGCDPAPGAWTLFNQKRLQLYDARKHSARTFSQVKGRIGAITSIDEQSLSISAQGGQIEVFKLRYDGGKKLPAPQFCAEAGLCLGTILGT